MASIREAAGLSKFAMVGRRRKKPHDRPLKVTPIQHGRGLTMYSISLISRADCGRGGQGLSPAPGKMILPGKKRLADQFFSFPRVDFSCDAGGLASTPIAIGIGASGRTGRHLAWPTRDGRRSRRRLMRRHNLGAVAGERAHARSRFRDWPARVVGGQKRHLNSH